MKDVSDDLSIRARRGELDEGAARQLALLLSGSFEARLAHQAGCEFDAEDSVLAGDEALAERVTQRLLAARPVAKPPRRWLKPALAGAVLAALAAALPLSQRVRPRVSAPVAAPTLSVAPVAIPAPVAVPVPVAVPTQSAAAAPLAAPVVAKKSRPARNDVSSPGAEADAESAAALFARANRARREAEPERAVALYERLQARYQTAPEALAAEISLGMLELQLGNPGAALPHFARYLERAPTGGLGPEALWGQAQAFSALGQAESARRSFRLLLSRYPDSAYAGAARAKLQARP